MASRFHKTRFLDFDGDGNICDNDNYIQSRSYINDLRVREPALITRGTAAGVGRYRAKVEWGNNEFTVPNGSQPYWKVLQESDVDTMSNFYTAMSSGATLLPMTYELDIQDLPAGEHIIGLIALSSGAPDYDSSNRAFQILRIQIPEVKRFSPRFTGTFDDFNGVECEVVISRQVEAGESVTNEEINFGEAPVIIEYPEKSIRDTVRACRATINLLDPVDNKYDDLNFGGNTAWQVEIKKDGELQFVGYVENSYRTPVKAPPYITSITAVDGLSTLKSYEFSTDTTQIFPAAPQWNYDQYTEIPYFDRGKIEFQRVVTTCLMNLPQPININVNSLLNEGINSDNKVLLKDIYFDNRLFFNDQNEPLNCYEVLEMVLKDHKLRVLQQGGKWYFDDISRYQSQNISWEMSAGDGGFSEEWTAGGIGNFFPKTVGCNGTGTLDHFLIDDSSYSETEKAYGKVKLKQGLKWKANMLPSIEDDPMIGTPFSKSYYEWRKTDLDAWKDRMFTAIYDDVGGSTYNEYFEELYYGVFGPLNPAYVMQSRPIKFDPRFFTENLDAGAAQISIKVRAAMSGTELPSYMYLVTCGPYVNWDGIWIKFETEAPTPFEMDDITNNYIFFGPDNLVGGIDNPNSSSDPDDWNYNFEEKRVFALASSMEINGLDQLPDDYFHNDITILLFMGRVFNTSDQGSVSDNYKFEIEDISIKPYGIMKDEVPNWVDKLEDEANYKENKTISIDTGIEYSTESLEVDSSVGVLLKGSSDVDLYSYEILLNSIYTMSHEDNQIYLTKLYRNRSYPGVLKDLNQYVAQAWADQYSNVRRKLYGSVTGWMKPMSNFTTDVMAGMKEYQVLQSSYNMKRDETNFTGIELYSGDSWLNTTD